MDNVAEPELHGMADMTPSDVANDRESSIGLLSPPCSGTVLPESSKRPLPEASDSDSGTVNPLYRMYEASPADGPAPTDMLMRLGERLNRLETENKQLRGEVGSLTQRVSQLETGSRSSGTLSQTSTSTPRRAATPIFSAFQLNADAAAFTPKLH